MYKTIEMDKSSRVGTIVLNKPPVNVMNLAMIEEINHALDDLLRDPEIAIMVFRASGKKAFSTGVDIKDHTVDKVESMLRSFHDIFRKLARSDKITVSVVFGYCLGGGMELAVFCDLVVAADNTIFGQPEINVGCYPPVAAVILPYLVGAAKANEIILLGENISAEEADRLGLVNRVVSPARLDNEARHLIEGLENKSAAVLRLGKKAMWAKRAEDLVAAIDEAERIYLEELVQSGDINEGIDAFIHKREPVWKHA